MLVKSTTNSHIKNQMSLQIDYLFIVLALLLHCTIIDRGYFQDHSLFLTPLSLNQNIILWMGGGGGNKELIPSLLGFDIYMSIQENLLVHDKRQSKKEFN